MQSTEEKNRKIKIITKFWLPQSPLLFSFRIFIQPIPFHHLWVSTFNCIPPNYISLFGSWQIFSYRNSLTTNVQLQSPISNSKPKRTQTILAFLSIVLLKLFAQILEIENFYKKKKISSVRVSLSVSGELTFVRCDLWVVQIHSKLEIEVWN